MVHSMQYKLRMGLTRSCSYMQTDFYILTDSIKRIYTMFIKVQTHQTVLLGKKLKLVLFFNILLASFNDCSLYNLVPCTYILREKCHVDFKLDILKYALFDVAVKITIKFLDGSNTGNFHQIMIFTFTPINVYLKV
jgi:hypothetical protein